eukprot:CAMPEP_0198150982 /NCGR_PEP_ID=MMETSP1443-20131203/53530_1 /TAXON_ID=186043 /ORGANISM="Entomoneis sp., Strain CCMP2396" /LENGTH=319 /DNA_ID=CAMNT_0043816487 /DNA_START=23 /DNA_END=979 /DNA_ORIENTATION=+
MMMMRRRIGVGRDLPLCDLIDGRFNKKVILLVAFLLSTCSIIFVQRPHFFPHDTTTSSAINTPSFEPSASPTTKKVTLRCPTEAETLPEMLKLASIPTGNSAAPTSNTHIPAGQQQEGIVFTTVTINKKTRDHVEWVFNWYSQLQEVGVPHPIVFGADDTGETCDIVRSLGMCCRNFDPQDFTFVDEPLQMVTRDGTRPPAVDIKFFYAFELLSHGYRTSFSDDDVFWFKYPFLHEFEEDMRGLTDDKSADDQQDGWTSTKCGLQYGSPCMSTGLWDMYPTNSSIKFLYGLLKGLKTTHTWEQQLANKFLKNERKKDDP